jgi:hypothetical protein
VVEFPGQIRWEAGEELMRRFLNDADAVLSEYRLLEDDVTWSLETDSLYLNFSYASRDKIDEFRRLIGAVVARTSSGQGDSWKEPAKREEYLARLQALESLTASLD